MRYLTTIQAYVPDIQYIEGAKNVVGDALSRALYQLRKEKGNPMPPGIEVPISDASELLDSKINTLKSVQSS